MNYAVSGMLGIDLTRVTAGTTTAGEGAEFTLGQCAYGTDGQEYVYVQAGAAISTTTDQPFALAIDENFQAVKLTKALALVGHMIAWAPEQIIADNAFFWAIKKGTNFNIKVGVSCAADIALWTTATAGVLDDTSGGSHVKVQGVVIVTAASTSASAGSTVREAIATYPIVHDV